MSDTRLILLTQGKFATVDLDTYEFLVQWKWRFRSGYASRGAGGRTAPQVSMHRLIMGYPVGMEVDHIDGNTLNNTRENLRICTHLQNMWNRKTPKSNTSGFTGVNFRKENGKWRARIGVAMKRINLGDFDTLEEAVSAYKAAAAQHYGEFRK